MIDRLMFTHKGWFGVCPVYFAGLETGAPLVHPRHRLFTPLMLLSELLFWVGFRVCEAVSPDFEPNWPLKVTGELNPPISLAGPSD